jgi:hypothetical protein
LAEQRLMRRLDRVLIRVLGSVGGQMALVDKEIDQRARASAGISDSRATRLRGPAGRSAPERFRVSRVKATVKLIVERDMNWLRGLLRACIPLVVLWVIFVLVGAYDDWPAEREYQTLSEFVEESALFAFLPPLMVVAFGCCVIWVGRERDAAGSTAVSLEHQNSETRSIS